MSEHRKKVENATDAEILQDVSYWEDPDQILLLCPNEEGQFIIANQEWKYSGKGDTLRDALIDYVRDEERLYPGRYGHAEDYKTLDWSGVLVSHE